MFQGAFKTLVMLILLPLFLPSAQAQMFVDQANTYSWSPGGQKSIQYLGPIGQGFRPTFSSLDVVELHTNDFEYAGNGVGADLFVTIRSGTITGPIIGTSETLSLPDQFSGVSRFAFISPVALVPGNTYVIEPCVAAGDNWAVGFTDPYPLGDGYPRGHSYVLGRPSGEDLWFREGVAVPEPGVLGLAASLVAGCSSIVGWRVRRRKIA